MKIQIENIKKISLTLYCVKCGKPAWDECGDAFLCGVCHDAFMAFMCKHRIEKRKFWRNLFRKLFRKFLISKNMKRSIVLKILKKNYLLGHKEWMETWGKKEKTI